MMVINGFVRIIIILFLDIISFYRSYANDQSCYNVGDMTICYFQPSRPTMTMAWEDAWKVCRENNATLPVIESQLVENTFKDHVNLKTSLKGYPLWLAGRDFRTDNWQWLNRQSVDREKIVNGQGYSNEYHTNVFLYIAESFQYTTNDPFYKKYYICHYKDNKLCQNKTTIIPWRHGCLFVNNDVDFNLVDARNRCLDEGGDLATFEEEEGLQALKMTNSSLLQRNKGYWIGLRRNWWIWNQTVKSTRSFESSKEIKYSNWVSYANHESKQCLHISTHDYKWNQETCSVMKRFLCQTVIIPTTTTQTQTTNDVGQVSITASPEEMTDFSTGIWVPIIGSIIAVVVVAIIIVVVIAILKTPKNREVRHRSEKKQTVQQEMSDHPSENKRSVESKEITSYEDVSNHYAEIQRVNVQDNYSSECQEESQPGVVYAALEFDANKGIYEEPDISSTQKQQRSAPAKASAAVNGDGQTGNSAEYSAQASEGTIYANF